MAANEANYEIQKKFDETLEANTDFDFSGEGPKFEEFAKELLDKNNTASLQTVTGVYIN